MSTLSWGIQMRENAESLLLEAAESISFSNGTVMFFGFMLGQSFNSNAIAFEEMCTRCKIRFIKLDYYPSKFWEYGICYTIDIETMDDFKNAECVIETFGGSTERFYLNKADVRIGPKEE